VKATLEELLAWLSSSGPDGVLQVFGLVAARLAPLVSLSPAFGGEALVQRLRVALIAMLAAVFGLALAPRFEPVGGVEFAGLLVKELLVGGLLALLVRLCFDAVATCGALIDLGRGAALASVLDPLSRQQASALAQFLVLSFTALYLTIGAHAWVLAALTRSFAAYPLGSFAPESLLGEGAMRAWISLGSELFTAAVMLAAPVLAVVFMLDAALGLAQRLAPSVQVFFLGGTAKGLIGVAVLLAIASALYETLLARTFELLDAFAR